MGVVVLFAILFAVVIVGTYYRRVLGWWRKWSAARSVLRMFSKKRKRQQVYRYHN